MECLTRSSVELCGDRVELVPLAEVAGKVKHVPAELLQVASALA